MREVGSRKRVLVWVFLILITLVSFYFDSEIVKGISYLRNSILTNFFMGITFVSSILIVFLFLTLIFIKENKRKWLIPLWLSLGLSAVVGFLLKISIQRLRPYQVGIVPVVKSLAEASHNVWDFSFPSFQAMMVFAAVPFLEKEFPKFKWVWIIFACLVAFSRVYLGVHFMSDVLVGSMIGYIIGFFAFRWWKEKFRLY